MHNFKYTLKILLKSKMLIFWTYAFPLILGTFFYLAFSDIENNEKLEIIDIAIIENESFNHNFIYQTIFTDLSKEENPDRLFRVKYLKTIDEAKSLLEKDEIIGYLELQENKPRITIKENGIEATIFNQVVEEISSNSYIMENIATKRINEAINIDPNVYQSIYESIATYLSENNINIKDISRANLSYTVIEYFTLIAMTCLYGGIIGLVAINKNLPNMCAVGKRIGISNIRKGSVIFSSAVASFLVSLVGLILLYIYTIFVLKIDYGTNLPLIILLSLVGSLVGLSLGIFIACAIKTNDNTKTGILIAITMLGCFLSGMMGITMKYVVDKNMPILNKLNPAALITDGFYSLYYYDTLDRYWENLVILSLWAVGLLIISSFILRRQKYDSI